MAIINSSAPIVLGAAGSDEINTVNGTPAQTVIGGAGNDIYWVDPDSTLGGSYLADVIQEAVNGGIDTVNVNLYLQRGAMPWSAYGSSGYTLGDNLENLNANLTSNNAAMQFNYTLHGNGLNNTIVATTFSDNARAYLYGNAGNDKLTVVGNASADELDGGAGIDTMDGGLGDDTYYVDNAADVVIENNIAGGYDKIFASSSYALSGLASNVEDLYLQNGSGPKPGNFNGTGNVFNNYIEGNDGNNTLAGLAGDDYLDGGDYGNDILLGGAGNDRLYTYWGNDKLDGGDGDDYLRDREGGNNTLLGGAGNDELRVSYGNNLLDGGTGDDYLRGGDGNDTLLGGAGDDYLRGYDGNDKLDGGAGNDRLQGGEGNNTLMGGAGDDQLWGNYRGTAKMDGGAGDDTYYAYAGDIVADTGGGNDTLYAYYGQAAGDLAAGVENLVLGYQTYNGRGNALDNVIIDEYGAHNTIYGLAGNDLILAGNGNDVLDGGTGNDTLDGGVGNDLMRGGAGNDTYFIDSINDLALETSAADGNDTIITNQNTVLSAFIENATLLNGAATTLDGNASANKLVGNSNNNTITGGAGNDTLDGGAGNDSLVGGAGDDTYYVDSAADVILELAAEGKDTVFSSAGNYTLSAELENLTLLSGAYSGTGNAGNNVITGNDSSNTLDGTTGRDTLIGGKGDDTYYVNGTGGAADDTIVELANQGYDSVFSSVTYSIATQANLEEIVLLGSDHINATGNAANNNLYGNTGNNKLDGGAGNDYLNARGGNDTLLGGAGNDDLNGDDGNDVLDGGAGNDTVYGGYGNDILLGGAGNDELNGGSGTNSMDGGAGNDIYYSYSATDTIAESIAGAAGGVDKVYYNAVGSFTLGANIENGELWWAAGNANLTGNALNNKLIGNAGLNTLDGGAGNDTLDGGYNSGDTLIGGAGNDTYILNSGYTVNITELAGGGIDTVTAEYTSIDLEVLSAEVENATLTGNSHYSVYGNALANVLIGNSGNNTLDGRAGADTMIGGAGDDTYTVDNSGDKVVELANGGWDYVRTTVTFNMATNAANVEGLSLLGSANIDGTGNALNNWIEGNSGNNKLDGGAGNDSLQGGAGVDTLTGGAGNDTFHFRDASGDVVTDYTQGADVIKLLQAAFGGITFNGAGNTLTADMFKLGTAAADANDHIIYNQATGQLYYDGDGNGAVAQVLIADFKDGLALSSTDIFAW